MASRIGYILRICSGCISRQKGAASSSTINTKGVLCQLTEHSIHCLCRRLQLQVFIPVYLELFHLVQHISYHEGNTCIRDVNLHLLLLVLPGGVSRGCAWTKGIVDSQRSSVVLLSLEYSHGVHSALRIREVSMRETSWLAGSAVDGDSNIDDITNTTEQVVQIAIGHFEGHVANEQGLAWRVLGFRGTTLVVTFGAVACFGGVGVCEGYHQTTTLEGLLVQTFDGSSCALGGFIFNVTKSVRH